MFLLILFELLQCEQCSVYIHLMFVLQRCGLQFIIMMPFKGNGEPRTHSIITTLNDREGKLPPDDAFLDAAQHFGVEVELDVHNKIRVNNSVQSVCVTPLLPAKLITSALVYVYEQNTSMVTFYMCY